MKFGIDRLLLDRAVRKPLDGRRVALLAHPASVTADLTHSIDALAAHEDFQLTAAFGPQHGMRGEKQDNMIETDDYKDPVYGIPVFSLYGKVRRWSREEAEQHEEHVHLPVEHVLDHRVRDQRHGDQATDSQWTPIRRAAVQQRPERKDDHTHERQDGRERPEELPEPSGERRDHGCDDCRERRIGEHESAVEVLVDHTPVANGITCAFVDLQIHHGFVGESEQVTP